MKERLPGTFPTENDLQNENPTYTTQNNGFPSERMLRKGKWMNRMMARYLVGLLVSLSLCIGGCGGSNPATQLKINELFSKSALDGLDDWLEIYNPGDQEVSLDGLQLKDVNGNTVWDFPAGTTIAAGGFLVIVCDDSGTGLRTNFKLTSKGETIILQTKDGQVIDEVTYPAQEADQSWGRETDGSDKWKVFTSPTPNKPKL
jgi:hypothetical protein